MDREKRREKRREGKKKKKRRREEKKIKSMEKYGTCMETMILVWII